MRAALLALVLVAAAAMPATAAAKTTWLCKPGLSANPCEPAQDIARYTPDGQLLGGDDPKPARRRIDCFYVYPTVSGQQTPTANRRIDPELRSIATWQAGRYAGTCRVFAPVYRQVTLAGLGGSATKAARRRAYRDVRAAWRVYLRRHNHGRGVVLIGHSQGTFHLRALLAEEIEPRRAQRRKVVSAILLGGNAARSDFERFRPCTRAGQIRCIIAFSTFNQPVPPDALFGRGTEVICTNPAALGGGEATIDAVFPHEPFAPGTAMAALVAALGFPVPESSATWLAFPDVYSARCAKEGGAHVLQVTPVPGAPVLTPVPTPGWGLHLADANIALGDLEALVRRQAAAYLRAGA
jgi:pimeloyl-ACP methyl ester carboxylesterase